MQLLVKYDILLAKDEKMINKITNLLEEITNLNCTVKLLDCGTVVIILPFSSAKESRWIMQAFNTSEFRAKRRDRSFQEIEVKLR